MEKNSKEVFEEFVQVVRELRDKCPWDSVQTHKSLMPHFLNETQEVSEAVDHLTESGDGDNLCEELGDILLHVILHGIIAEEEGLFTVEDIISRVMEKMKFRHPRIFSPEDEEAAALSWDELKKLEKEKFGKP